MDKFDFNTLPPVENVRKWAGMLVARYGDAHANYCYIDGLRTGFDIIGEQPMVVQENVGNPRQGGINLAISIQVATYPAEDFDAPFWDKPNRKATDLTWDGHGRHNRIVLPRPLMAPTLVRVVNEATLSSLPEGRSVTYQLFELEPGFQRRAAETKAVRAAHTRR